MIILIIITIILIIFLIYNKSLNSLLIYNTTEDFLITVKDRQKVGTIDNDDGVQPKSTWKTGGINYESCYSTETRNGNTTGRHGKYYCDNGVDAGEIIPSDGLYSIDFSNYKIHPGKADNRDLYELSDKELKKIPTVARSIPTTIHGRGPIFGRSCEATPAPMMIPTVNGKKAKPARSGE